jgi:alkyl sulfatase BDS1-like metallo-beta-lactamase superfamily hydrolase
MVRLALLNWRRAPMTAGFIAIMTVVHPAQSQETKPAEPKPTVAAANRAVRSQLPFGDRQDFEDAMRGFTATTPDPANPDRWAFLKHEAPPTVNPSLWRQAQINVANGDPPRRKTRYL